MTNLFTHEEMTLLGKKKIPHHIAMIMDGNRRWEKSQKKPILSGHKQGAENLYRIITAAKELGIRVITVYAFSTENWSRPVWEVTSLFTILENYLTEKREILQKEGVRLDLIGNWQSLSPKLQKALQETREYTKEGKNMDLVLAVNYGGRDEIRRASLRMMEDIEKKKLTKEKITEDLFSQYLDTAKWPDPDLLIRTGGEKRISNFLLWQTSYTELVVTDVLWPDFSPKDLYETVLEFQRRNRRKGG
jgi:undecaprenyl diphosphate synthase